MLFFSFHIRHIWKSVIFLFCSIKYLLKEAAGKTIMNFSIFQISINFFKVGMNPWIIGCRRRQNHLCFGAVEARNWQGSRKSERERVEINREAVEILHFSKLTEVSQKFCCYSQIETNPD